MEGLPEDDEFSVPAPKVSPEDARAAAERFFGVSGVVEPLESERDKNFRITDEQGNTFVLKIANPGEDPAVAAMQVDALRHIESADPGLPVPRVRLTVEGAPTASMEVPGGGTSTVRMVTFLDGVIREAADFDADAMRELGRCLASLQRALRGFFHPAAGRTHLWDLRGTPGLVAFLDEVDEGERRAVAARVIDRFDKHVGPALPACRAQVIHDDLTSDNIVFDPGEPRITGIIDFGDLLHGPLVCDLAVTAATVTLGHVDPLKAIGEVVAGYSSLTPLEPEEIDLLPDLVAARLAAWVLVAAWRVKRHPENAEYINALVEEAWQVLELFDGLGAHEVHRRFRELTVAPAPRTADDQQILERRRRVLGPALPISYDRAVHVVRGEGVWLYDLEGRAYLDAYNNVPVVGHAHPRVVEALTRQARRLNTNPRYLHEGIVELAERLTSTMPDGLDTCFFVNSGSEANDVAWRFAREATGNDGAVITAYSYFGITAATSAISPETWPSGYRPAQVATVPAPDGYRGVYRREEVGWAKRYAAHVADAAGHLREGGFGCGICIADSSFASDGIFFPPPEYLQDVVLLTHEAGGLFIADEVQAGHGRTGNLWSFEASGVAPDFVTLGKPMGNGHPVAAVVMRREIADAFAERNPELFSTYGGNTVSTAVALAVLDVIEEEGLLGNAAEVGAHLQEGLQGLAGKHELVGDVRGAGLMVGVELVRDRETREPASGEADEVLNAMRERGVLIGSTGPDYNVLKIRPPLPFSRANTDLLIEALDESLSQTPRPSG